MFINQIATYWNSRAYGYSQTIHEQLGNEEHDYFRRLLNENAPAGESLSCLDIGCGPGFFSILLAQDGHRVTAVDYSEGMLERARANFEEMGVKVKAVQGDAQDLSFADNSFDYIVSRNLVWNLERPADAYREWTRLLKPGGRLLVVDGNHYLYYYDKEYSSAKKASVIGRRHSNIYGVDPTPINEIARDLPLSHEYRPDWDVKVMEKLGLENIDVHVSHADFTDPEDGTTKSIVTNFAVCAGKPVCIGEERQSAMLRSIYNTPAIIRE